MGNLDLLKDIDVLEYLGERDVVEGVVGKHNVTIKKEEDGILTLYNIFVKGEKYATEGSKFLIPELCHIKYMTTEDIKRKVKQIKEFNQLEQLEQDLKEELTYTLKDIEEPLIRIKTLLEVSEHKGFDVDPYEVGIQLISTLESITNMLKNKN